MLLEAARSNCYVENTGNKADSLHRRISQSYEEDISNAYLKVITPLLKYRRITLPMLAIDFTDEEFYGYSSDLWLHPWTGEAGVQATYTFAVLSLVGKHKVPLLAVPVHVGMDTADLVQMFLSIAKKLFKHIRCILLDAGFYSGAVIEVLKHERYIIRAPRNEPVKKFIAATKTWKLFFHTIQWDGNRTRNKTPTTIVIVKHVLFKKIYVDCAYATNIQLKEGMDYVHLYCKRWQIETNFRMEDQVHIKSKSLLIIIRFFYFMISLLMHALWILFWFGTMPFATFKIHAANQLQFAAIGIFYDHPVL